MKPATQLKSFEDRRKYPRLRLDIPVKVKYQSDKFVEARLYDISPDGLQIRCDQPTAGLIHPSGKPIPEHAQPSVLIGFTLPANNENSEIIVKFSIWYFALLTDGAINEVAFGLCFRQFKGDCRQRISQYFLSEMEPAWDSDVLWNNFGRHRQTMNECP